MALPVIPAYPMPTVVDIPQNKVDWKPDSSRAVLLIHDMQNYFMDAYETRESPVNDLIANLRLLKNRCQEAGIPVIYTRQPGGQTPDERGLLLDFWGPGLNDGPYQQAIIQELSPGVTDLTLTKWRYSAFQKTELRAIMRDMKRDQLLIGGVYAHIGCLMTACEAFMLDIEAFCVADAQADFSRGQHQMALHYAAERCAAVWTTGQLLNELKVKQEARTGSEPAITKKYLAEAVAAMIPVSPLDLNDQDNLVQQGIDSIRMMSLVETLRGKGASVTFTDLAESPTLADWWALISSESLTG
ncbi:isochorismatase family protein [Paenibacillus tarimensis]|uniref:isochorismatase family protein n=1 Tax=Paenibacillus tarimensis TaxID=416012 RepID=UPI001F176DD6|nr:isochorismatase family protein [Paenibacillus tarimensis]MCF2945522.1 isochorismatase family protein [Paenibacillus tarimensis]